MKQPSEYQFSMGINILDITAGLISIEYDIHDASLPSSHSLLELLFFSSFFQFFFFYVFWCEYSCSLFSFFISCKKRKNADFTYLQVVSRHVFIALDLHVNSS